MQLGGETVDELKKALEQMRKEMAETQVYSTSAFCVLISLYLSLSFSLLRSFLSLCSSLYSLSLSLLSLCLSVSLLSSRSLSLWLSSAHAQRNGRY